MNATKYCTEPGKGNLSQALLDEISGTGKRKKPHRKFNRGLVWIFVIIILAIIVASLFLVLPLVNKRAGRTAIIRVPANATEQSVEDSIAKYLGREYAESCHKAMRIIKGNDEPFRHGAWAIEEGMTPFSAARQLMRGGQTGISVTLNGQRTKEDVARLFAAKLECTPEQFLDALNDEQLLHKYNVDPDHALCLFLEDKYEFYWTATPEQVIEKMNENYHQFWNADRLDKAEALDLLPRGVVVLASIVDSETQQSGEKGAIGRLYVNRLNEDMYLQADPTVLYAWRTDPSKKGKVDMDSITRVTSEMTKLDNPYNTYKYKDLPPGPIRLTSKTTIDAILTSRPHEYLYMCADESLSGMHNFAVTYEEHLANSKRYQQAMDARGVSVNAQNEKLTGK